MDAAEQKFILTQVIGNSVERIGAIITIGLEADDEVAATSEDFAGPDA